MRIISFAWTTEVLLQRRKTATRRTWKECYVKPGQLVQAYDKSPRFGGSAVAIIEIEKVYQQRLCDMTDEDEIKEGHLWNDAEGFRKSFISAYQELTVFSKVWVIEFKIKKIL